jgi:hypothetical protein
MIGRALTYLPSDLEAHKDITKLINNRRDMLKTGKGITWAFAEALAFGSLMTHFSPGRRDINASIYLLSLSSLPLSSVACLMPMIIIIFFIEAIILFLFFIFR